jgi:O-antigen/teichoic acid export membrane protein
VREGSSGRVLPVSLFSRPGAIGWGLLGSAAYGFFQWLTLAVLARAGTPELVGRFTLGLAITAPVIMFFNMQLGWLQATDQAGHFPFRDYRDQRFTALACAGLIILLLARARPDPVDRLVILLVGASKVIESASDLCIGNFQRNSRLDFVARSQLVRGVLSVGFFATAMVSTQRLTTALLAMGVAWLTSLTLHDWRTNRRLVAREPSAPSTGRWRERIGRLTADAAPLGISALLVSLNVSMPRLVIERELGSHALGVFAAMAYLVVAGRMVALPFAQVVAPKLGAAVAAGDLPRFRWLISRLVMVACLLGGLGVAVAAVAGREVLTLLYGRDYAGEAATFVVLMLGSTLGYVALFFQIGSTAVRMLRGQVVVVLVSVVATTIASLVAVPRYGVLGGAVGMLVGAVAELLGGAILLRLAIRRLGDRRVAPIAAVAAAE